MAEKKFNGAWPKVLDQMKAWIGDIVISSAIARPHVVVVIDATLVLGAKRAGANVKQEFTSFRSALERQYRGNIRFGWVESATGHRVSVEAGVRV